MTKPWKRERQPSLPGQFAALAIAILLLSSFASGTAFSTPSIVSVNWGGPSSQFGLSKNSINQEKQNENTISAFYTLAVSTTPSSASASRLCLNSNGTGGTLARRREADRTNQDQVA
jgi:hypothetical protein